MITENVKIPDHQADFIRDVIASGRYDDINEVIQAGVVLLEQQLSLEDQQRERLGELLDEAIATGISAQTPEQIWDEVEAAHRDGNE